MPTILISILKQYAKAVFIDHPGRTLDSVPALYKSDDPATPSVQKFAAGILVVNDVPTPSNYYVETIDEALASGNITEAQHAEVLALNPDMAHRPGG